MQMERVPERRLEPPPEKPMIEPVCPVCGAECDTFYVDKDGDVCGCDVCRTAVDAWEWVNR